jgi:hypothetical protein
MALIPGMHEDEDDDNDYEIIKTIFAELQT